MIASTSTQIAIVRMASLRGMLRLEKAGMTTSGGALRPRIAAELGLKPRASHDVFIANITARIAVLQSANQLELALTGFDKALTECEAAFKADNAA